MTFDRLFNWNNIFVYNSFIDNKNTEIQLFLRRRNGYCLTKQPLNYPPGMTKINLCLRYFIHCLKINMLREYCLKFVQGHKHCLVLNRA